LNIANLNIEIFKRAAKIAVLPLNIKSSI